LASAQATGGACSDTLSNLENLLGGKYNDKLTGSGGANLINGGAGNDKLTGGGGSDILIGSAGGDVLNGGGGHDTLRGDLGTDTFQFTGTPANANSDVISDFKSAQGDHIDLKIAGLGPVGTLNGALFAHGAGMVAAPSAGVHVFYDDTSGKLYYDADGSGGASAPVLMAKLTGHPTLTASDIHVI
jgi:Ca2+-binding RTX toxin-like protein